MKRIKFFFRILAALLIVQLYACEKILDQLPGKPKNCRIKRIFFAQSWYPAHYGTFYYNKWGNPDSVIYGYVGTAITNKFFKYNKKQQLIEAKFNYSDGNKERWDKFGYKNDFITTDTVYMWPTREEPEPLYYTSKSIWSYEYDYLGRIIKETRNQIYPDLDTQVINYAYDQNGNQIYGSNYDYDNYNNINVLHPIWQFLSRNYSLNNIYHAAAYNNFRLPTKFGSETLPDRQFLDRSLVNAEIEYDCK